MLTKSGTKGWKERERRRKRGRSWPSTRLTNHLIAPLSHSLTHLLTYLLTQSMSQLVGSRDRPVVIHTIQETRSASRVISSIRKRSITRSQQTRKVRCPLSHFHLPTMFSSITSILSPFCYPQLRRYLYILLLDVIPNSRTSTTQ